MDRNKIQRSDSDFSQTFCWLLGTSKRIFPLDTQHPISISTSPILESFFRSYSTGLHIIIVENVIQLSMKQEYVKYEYVRVFHSVLLFLFKRSQTDVNWGPKSQSRSCFGDPKSNSALIKVRCQFSSCNWFG